MSLEWRHDQSPHHVHAPHGRAAELDIVLNHPLVSRRHAEVSQDAGGRFVVRDLDSLDVAECIIAGGLVDVPFLLCKIDSIEVAKHKKRKFEFKMRKKQNVAGFDYA